MDEANAGTLTDSAAGLRQGGREGRQLGTVGKD
jgi:hypothetical protein